MGKHDALRGLVRAHLELSQTTPPPFGPELVLRAAKILQDAVHDEHRELLALDPDDAEARKALPTMLRKAGRFQELRSRSTSDRAVAQHVG